MPPVRRANVEGIIRLGINPPVQNAAARKCQGIGTVVIDHGQL